MQAALDLLARIPAVLVFLGALTIVAECASLAGLFDVVGEAVVRVSRGRVVVVWLLFMAVAVLVTAFLSLDTTAVLMTSAAIVVARRVERPVSLFAFPTLWVANMASMWLPVSNLTNLLARDVLPHPNALGFLAESWPVALTTTLVPLGCAGVIWRKDLAGSVMPGQKTSETSTTRSTAPRTGLLAPVALIVGGMCLAILIVEPAVAASVAAALCVVVIAIRRREALQDIEVPWRSLLITSALFCTVALVHGSGVLRPALDELGGAPAWMLTLVGGLTANGLNNLPAYLALEPAAHGESLRLFALLVGVNVASSVTWWGSVATLLWKDRLRRASIRPSWGTHLRLTGVVCVLTTIAALGALELGHP